MLNKRLLFDEKLRIINHACGIRLPDCSKMAVDSKNDNKVTIYLDKVIVNFFNVIVFVFSSLDSGPNFMSLS